MCLRGNLTLSLVLCIVAGYVGYGLSGDCLVGAACNSTAACASSYYIGLNNQGQPLYCINAVATSHACSSCGSTSNNNPPDTCWLPTSGNGIKIMTCQGQYSDNSGNVCNFSYRGCVPNTPCP